MVPFKPCSCFDSDNVHDSHLLEGSLGEQVTFDPGQGFVGVVVGLLDETQLLPLGLVQTRLDTAQNKNI